MKELIIIAIVIVLLNFSGLWPVVVRGLRELRGDRVEPEQSIRPSGQNMDMCFKLLGISPSASWDEIERAYRNKAKVHHPDRGGDEDAMRALNDAYSTLKQIRGRD